MSKIKTGICPICGKNVLLTPIGVLGSHHGIKTKTCPGEGNPPKRRKDKK